MYIKVKVYPNSKKESIEKVGENRLDIKVKEKAEKNMANNRVIELVARHCNVSVGKVRIINGHHSPSKMLSVEEE